MRDDQQVIDSVFVTRRSAGNKLRTAVFPWIKKPEPTRTLSIAAGSDLQVVHDSVMAPPAMDRAWPPMHTPPAEPDEDNFNSPNNWGNYFDFYDDSLAENECWDVESNFTSVSQVTDGSSYEPQEYMEDVPVNLPGKKQNKIKKLLLRGSKFEAVDQRTPPYSRQVSGSLPAPKSKKLTLFSRHHEPVPAAAVTDVPEVSDQSQRNVFIDYFRSIVRATVVLEPIDRLVDFFPQQQSILLILEILVVMWVLYMVSVVVETAALTIRAFCMPLIIIGRVFGYL